MRKVDPPVDTTTETRELLSALRAVDGLSTTGRPLDAFVKADESLRRAFNRFQVYEWKRVEKVIEDFADQNNRVAISSGDFSSAMSERIEEA